MKKFVITDIHGCRLTFQKLLEKVKFSDEDKLFLLGDYIDRGPDSKGVISDIMYMQKQGIQIECIRGNHEDQMLLAKNNPSEAVQWWRWGGKETTASFGYSLPSEIKKIPNKYWKWLNDLPHYIEEDNYIMVHAGLNFKVPDPMNDYSSILWARQWYDQINYNWLEDRIIIHGHTPANQEAIEDQLQKLDYQQYLDIDNGCYKNKNGQGQLCAFEITERKLTFQERIDKSRW